MKLKIWLKVIIMAYLGSVFVYAENFSVSNMAEEYTTDSNYAGKVKMSGTTLEFGEYIVAMEFGGLSIPKNATITEANITFTSASTRSYSSVLDIYAEKSVLPNAIDTDEYYNLSNRVKTTQKVTWNTDPWSSNVNYVTPDLKTVVQELVNQENWNELASKIMFIFDANSNKQEAVPSSIVLSITYNVEDNNEEESSGTLYENSEDGTTNNWTVYDNDPIGATISNVFDADRNSRVIQFQGDGRANAYRMGNSRDREGRWNNQTDKTITWSMMFSEKFKVSVYLETSEGYITIYYTHVESDNIDGKTIGLGANSRNGTWQTISRNLIEDLQTLQINGELLAVHGIQFQGSGFTDNIFMGTYNIPEAIILNSNPCTSDNINSATPCSVSTFHNLSLYWSPADGNLDKNVTILYKKKTEDDIAENWKKAQDMIYKPLVSLSNYENPSPKNGRPTIKVNKGDIVGKGDYRGSIVNLEPNTSYDIKMTLVGGDTVLITATTWNETFIKEQTYTILNGGCTNYNNGDTTCTIDKHGSKENGYIVIDGEGQTLQNINVIGGEYIIIRNFNLIDAPTHAIVIAKNSHHIVIEDCNISQWGSVSTKKTVTGEEGKFEMFGAEHHAIYSEFNLSNSIIQRNRIFNPKHDSNSWAEVHGRDEINETRYNELQENNPYNIETGIDNGKYYEEEHHTSGAQGITLLFCETGNNVIRYNEFYSVVKNNGEIPYFNDVIGGGANGSYHGFPGADSDIYGNYVANSWDDGIEAEGGGQNIRIWNNYIEKTYIAIANAAVSVGPLYIWRNISGEAAELEDDKPNKLEMGKYSTFLKMGYAGSINFMTGHMYVYNNTILNIKDENEIQHGYGGLGTGEGSNRIMKNITTRNNILHVRNGMNSISKHTETHHLNPNDTNESYGFDMVMPRQINGDESEFVPNFYTNNKIEGIPNYDGQARLFSNKSGNFKLDSNSKGFGEGKCIPNIIRKNNIGKVDIGAQDSSVSHMYFGVDYNFTLPSIFEECLN